MNPRLLLLFFSGWAALVYPILWGWQMRRVTGGESMAVALTVGAFMAGWALGAAWWGRWADRSARPYGVIAGLQMGSGVLGVGSTLILAGTGALGVAGWGWPLLWVGLPAFLMGGAVPVWVREHRPRHKMVSGVAGRLFAIHMAGGMFGALMTSFLLLPHLGLVGTGAAAALVNMLVALGAARINGTRAGKASVSRAASPLSAEAWQACFLGALVGGVTLGLVVVWTEILLPLLDARGVAWVAGTCLAGLAAGSAVQARFSDRTKTPWRVFGGLVAAMGISSLALVGLLGGWLPALQQRVGGIVLEITGSATVQMGGRQVTAALLLLLPPLILSGATYPVALRLVAGAPRAGRDAGLVTAFHGMGGVAGMLFTGLVFIPRHGLVRSVGMLAVMTVGLGAMACVLGSKRRRPTAVMGMVAVVVMVIAAWWVPRDKLGRLLADRRGEHLVYYEEDWGGSVAVLEHTSSGRSFRRLCIQGVSNSEDSPSSVRRMRLQALLPLLVHKEEPRSALVVGLGPGVTAGSLLAYPHLARRVCAESRSGVIRVSSLFQGHNDASRDSRLDIRPIDGRRLLELETNRYDLIVLNPPPAATMGAGDLYSLEFHLLCRDRLRYGGLVAQRWSLSAQHHAHSQAIVRTLLEVFPHVALWITGPDDMLILGSMTPIELDVVRMDRRWQLPNVKRALEEVGVHSPADLLATFISDRAGLEAYAGVGPVMTDNRPRWEEAPRIAEGGSTEALDKVLQVRTAPHLQAGGDWPVAVETRRSKLLEQYRGRSTP